MTREERGAEAPRPQNIILESRKRLSVSGVTEVMSFDEQEIVMRTALGELTVRGGELKVENLAVESGELTVSGRVDVLGYREAAPSWRERLFG